jgi:outer membrane receptor protein involved in Fe transport
MRMAGAVAFGMATTAAAQPPSDPPEAIEEVIVTAQKRAQPSFEVPLSIAVVTGDTLESLDLDTALGLSYRVPSLVVQESAPGNQLYTIRGVGNSVGSSSLVGVYLDEVDMTQAGGFGQHDISLYDLERVEVLRGPQGTLYGAGSVGGTIRLITNRPQLTTPSGKAEASIFAQARGDPGYEFKAALDVPVVADVFGLRLALNHHDWGGWIDQPAADREDINDNKLTDARLRARWQANDRFTVDGSLIVHRNEGGGSNIVNLPPYSESLFRTFIDPALETPYVDDYDHYNLTASYAFDQVELLSATGFTGADQFGVTSRRFTFAEELIPGFPGSDVYEGITRYAIESDVLTQELRASSDADGPFNWVAGVFFRKEELDGRGLFTQALGGAILAWEIPGAQRAQNDSRSVFGDASHALGERWEVGAGVRYFEEDRYLADPLGGSSQTDTFRDTSPRVYLSFAPADEVNLYVNVAQGFRSGGFNGAEVEALGAPGSYGPEEVTSLELGSKLRRADGRLEAEFVLFRSDYSDMQAWGAFPGAFVDVIYNIGKAEIKGFEWSAAWRPSDRLALGFNGSVIDTTVVEANADNTSHLPGDPLDQVADYGWSVFGDYSFAWCGGRPGFLRAGYDAQGPIHLTDRSVGFAQPVSASDTLGFLYARIGIRFGAWVVELFGDNLLDEHGKSNPYDIGALETQPRPRVMGVRVAYAFE